MKANHVKCEQCGKRNSLNSYRLDPSNWRKAYRRLCAPCRTKLGYALEYERRKEKTNY